MMGLIPRACGQLAGLFLLCAGLVPAQARSPTPLSAPSFAPSVMAASAAQRGSPGELERASPQAVQALYAAADRGGLVQLPPGLYVLPRTLVLKARTRLQGAGRGVTVLRLGPGVNANLLETERFAQLQGTTNLAQAPADITVLDLSLDGNFLSSKWTDPARQVLNERGSCLALYGRRLHVDVEASNCAEHLLYTEGQGARASEEVSSQFRLDGMVAGEECVVFRGAGDSRIEHLGAGVCGAKRMQPSTSAQRSRWYPQEPGFDGLVLERQTPYEGTVEIGFAHVFGVFSGWGVRTRGNARVHAKHLISESSLGGVLVDKLTWGAISLLDVHSNGKSMGFKPTPPARAALRVESEVGFSVAHGTLFRTVGSAEGFTAAELTGKAGQFNLVLLNSKNPQTGEDHQGEGVWLSGEGNLVRLSGTRQAGVGVRITGNANRVESLLDAPLADEGRGNLVQSIGSGAALRQAEPALR